MSFKVEIHATGIPIECTGSSWLGGPDAVDQNFEYSPQFSDDSTILVVNKPEFSTNPILIPEGVEIQRPDAVDEEIKILPMVLQKPDGGR
ncbi:hypothetical protein MFLAVUS_006479 [Mucor flavus]|uniref:Uncharacterized protein n=1 Tax=Mucor flavus TaxID=439312 RepID=A0ABP9Z1N9_9FUNG